MSNNSKGKNQHGTKDCSCLETDFSNVFLPLSLDPPDDVLKKSLEKYVAYGLTREQKVIRLFKDHGLSISFVSFQPAIVHAHSDSTVESEP